MKKILIFSTAYLPMLGGAEVAVKEITDRLAYDFEFDLICAKIKKGLPDKEKIGNIEIWRLGSGSGKLDKFLLPWRGKKLATRLQQEKRYDAIWAIMASFGGLAALKFKQKFPDVPYLLTLQEGDSPEHIRSRARFLGSKYQKIFSQADFVTTISRYLKDYALSQGAKSEIEIVPNGVDIKKFEIRNSKSETNSNAQNLKLKMELGIKDDEKVIITVSRLVEKNGIGDIIETLQYLPENIKLLILGSGPLEKNLKLKTKNLKLDRRVLFLGNVPNEEVPNYLAIADVFVRPSLSEGLGNSFLEAMAAGVSVVGTKVGGIPDFLRDGETGLFCEVNNPQSIAEKTKILINDSELRQKLVANAKKLVAEKYNWNLIAEKMRDVFNKLTT